MRSIRNKVRYLISIESRYFNRRSALSFLIVSLLFMLFFQLLFALFFYYGSGMRPRDGIFVRYAAMLAASYLGIFLLYRLLTNRFFGFHYALVMGMTALSYLASATLSFVLFRTVWCFDLNRLINNPAGFEPLLLRALSDSFYLLPFFFGAYLLFTLVPAKRHRTHLLGRFWFLPPLTPLLPLPIFLCVLIFVPPSERVQTAVLLSRIFLSLQYFLFARFAYKALLYLLFPDDRTVLVTETPFSERPVSPPITTQAPAAEPLLPMEETSAAEEASPMSAEPALAKALPAEEAYESEAIGSPSPETIAIGDSQPFSLEAILDGNESV